MRLYLDEWGTIILGERLLVLHHSIDSNIIDFTWKLLLLHLLDLRLWLLFSLKDHTLPEDWVWGGWETFLLGQVLVKLTHWVPSRLTSDLGSHSRSHRRGFFETLHLIYSIESLWLRIYQCLAQVVRPRHLLLPVWTEQRAYQLGAVPMTTHDHNFLSLLINQFL